MVESGRAARPRVPRVDARGKHQAGGKISFVGQRRLFQQYRRKADVSCCQMLVTGGIRRQRLELAM
jgi:hypothetical protein